MDKKQEKEIEAEVKEIDKESEDIDIVFGEGSTITILSTEEVLFRNLIEEMEMTYTVVEIREQINKWLDERYHTDDWIVVEKKGEWTE